MTSRGTILVTGGAGFIGAHAAKALAAAGWTPVVYDSLIRGFREAVRWGPLVVGDILDAVTLAETLARYQPKAILHLAGLIAVGESVARPGPYYRANVSGSFELMAVNANGPRLPIVFASSASVYGEPKIVPMPETHPTAPLSPYGHSKLWIEQGLADFQHAYGTPWVALRYFNAAGADPEGALGESHDPETHLIPLAVDAVLGLRPALKLFGDDYPTPDGTCIRDYIHVVDLASAFVKSIDHLLAGGESGAINLGTGQGASVREVLDAVARVGGRPVPHAVAPRRPGDTPVLVADPAKAMAMLGWAPVRSDLDTLVADAWRWLARPDRPPLPGAGS